MALLCGVRGQFLSSSGAAGPGPEHARRGQQGETDRHADRQRNTSDRGALQHRYQVAEHLSGLPQKQKNPFIRKSPPVRKLYYLLVCPPNNQAEREMARMMGKAMPMARTPHDQMRYGFSSFAQVRLRSTAVLVCCALLQTYVCICKPCCTKMWYKQLWDCCCSLFQIFPCCMIQSMYCCNSLCTSTLRSELCAKCLAVLHCATAVAVEQSEQPRYEVNAAERNSIVLFVSHCCSGRSYRNPNPQQYLCGV